LDNPQETLQPKRGILRDFTLSVLELAKSSKKEQWIYRLSGLLASLMVKGAFMSASITIQK